MRVLLADDHVLFRDGLRSLLEARGFEVAGEASTGQEALDRAKALEPEVVLMDLKMPQMDGLTATRLIKASMPAVKVIVLTASEEDEDLFEALKSGAQGYLLKNLRADQLVELLEAAGRGEPALSPALAAKVLAEFARAAEEGPTGRRAQDPNALTEREMEVLQLLVEGVTTNRELAERLVVSENTVKYHLRNILQKLHLHNRTEVVAFAVRHGIVPPPE